MQAKILILANLDCYTDNEKHWKWCRRHKVAGSEDDDDSIRESAASKNNTDILIVKSSIHQQWGLSWYLKEVETNLPIVLALSTKLMKGA